ncbi:MAG: Hsp20/alpha crystallin family protein [Chloroflexi bacterium]|nr:Hsp20/alpha crystallin family protein [Chloroflexota bacterium]
MAVEIWRPMREMRRFADEMERLMEEFPFERHLWEPMLGARMRVFPVNLFRRDNDLVIEASLPGIRPEDVDVSVAGRTLTIRAERKEAAEVKEENYYYRELGVGRFFRQITLPIDVQADKAEASYENGVLRLRLPSVAAAKEAHIKVKAIPTK